MLRSASGSSARATLAVLAALVATRCGASHSADLAEIPRQPSDPLVNALGAEELEKFAVVDMADAVERVSGVEVAAKAD